MHDRRQRARRDGWPRHASARTWALAGALWGLLSMAPALASHLYFNEVFGYRAGRLMLWVLPSWYARLAIQAAGLPAGMPGWVMITLTAIVSAALGATIGLVFRSGVGCHRKRE